MRSCCRLPSMTGAKREGRMTDVTRFGQRAATGAVSFSCASCREVAWTVRIVRAGTLVDMGPLGERTWDQDGRPSSGRPTWPGRRSGWRGSIATDAERRLRSLAQDPSLADELKQCRAKLNKARKTGAQDRAGAAGGGPAPRRVRTAAPSAPAGSSTPARRAASCPSPPAAALSPTGHQTPRRAGRSGSARRSC